MAAICATVHFADQLEEKRAWRPEEHSDVPTGQMVELPRWGEVRTLCTMRSHTDSWGDDGNKMHSVKDHPEKCP